MTPEERVLAGLQEFARAVTAKMTQATPGEPEDQLRAPFEGFMNEVGQALSLNVVSTGEARLGERLGKPDYAVHVSKLLAGYVELKAPGTGANPNQFTGHNRQQWKRFQAIPNLLYCDGNSWALYRSGKAVGKRIRVEGDIASDGSSAIAEKDAEKLLGLLRDFLSWEPIVPTTKGKINLKRFATFLAPLCRMLREDVTEAMRDETSPLVALARDWRHLLFPDADDDQFADAYAQTVTFALLLARDEGADPLSLESAEATLTAGHGLLSKALEVLTDATAREEIAASLNLLIRVIGVVPPKALMTPEDPWIYFYEDFLAVYDPKLRKDAGAYYTPIEVVRAQVRLTDELLTSRLGKPLGFADSEVVTLDPAVGTGTYLLGIIEHVLTQIEEQQGAGAVPGMATSLARNVYGFEIMVGPFAVSELRVSRALVARGARLPADGTHVYLTDTLENPKTTPPQMPLFMKPIADQRLRALEVKDRVPVIVCLGNPPYDRHEAAEDGNRAQTGGWVRWGDDERGSDAILKEFLNPALKAGHGRHVKNLYNLYVYFWRWALWKVFEHSSASGPGVVSFISASSYLDGDAFCGMREHMRRECDEIWVIDLGGEGRGPRKSENVFAIQTPVAIAIAFRAGKADRESPAKIHFTRIDGTRREKLMTLDSVSGLGSLGWEMCAEDWQASFRPAGSGEFFAWPQLTDLMPWQHSGAQLKRTWPIAPDPKTLQARWRALLASGTRATWFKETRDRKIGRSYPSLLSLGEREKPLSQLSEDAPAPAAKQYSYRSLDRQWVFADSRLGDFLRPDLWRGHGDRQVYIASLLTKPVGEGPAAMASAAVPDLDFFSGRGAKDIVPLYRDSSGQYANIGPGLLERLEEEYGAQVEPADFLSYAYGILAQPAFTNRYAAELENRELRLPLTKDKRLFRRVRTVGAKLLWLHTYGERFVPKGKQQGQVPKGTALCTKQVPGEAGGYPETFRYNEAGRVLHVGNGEFAPVAPEVYEFEVSGLRVIQSWLNYRMKTSTGRKSSPLDDIRPERWTSDFTTELLELLWVLEATIAEYPEQAKLLEAVVEGACFNKDELPDVPDSARKPPKAEAQPRLIE